MLVFAVPKFGEVYRRPTWYGVQNGKVDRGVVDSGARDGERTDGYPVRATRQVDLRGAERNWLRHHKGSIPEQALVVRLSQGVKFITRYPLVKSPTFGIVRKVR